MCSIVWSCVNFRFSQALSNQTLLTSAWCLQDVHGPLLHSSLRAGLSAAQLAVSVRQAAFVESADCFAGMLADPQVCLSARY